jgi:hypothetical protein
MALSTDCFGRITPTKSMWDRCPKSIKQIDTYLLIYSIAKTDDLKIMANTCGAFCAAVRGRIYPYHTSER